MGPQIVTFIYLLVFVAQSAFSQLPLIINQGEIQFERKVNTFAVLDKYYLTDPKGGEQFAEQYKAKNEQFKTSIFTLLFNDSSSYYAPQQENEVNKFLSTLAGTNMVYTDLKHHTSSARKNVFGNFYIINDTIREIKWKITNEVREIIGFTCRRANAVILDSVYVVAFYTDQIVCKGGPESFSGLPGMILGVVLPHEHITWFATTFTLKQPADNLHNIPKGDKILNYKELLDLIQKSSIIKNDEHKRDFYIHNILY